MTVPLPSTPSLDQLKNQAKDLVKRFKARDPEAIRRVHEHFPGAERVPSDGSNRAALLLSEAQLVIAREYGFPSWPKLKRHVEATKPDLATATEAFISAVRAGNSFAVRRLVQANPALRAQIDAPLCDFDSPAILVAAGRSDRKMVDVLLELGASIHARSKWWAGSFGVLPHNDPDFAQFLISRGAEVDVWAAASLGWLDRLAALIDADPACVNARGGDGMGPLHYAKTVETARLLLDHGAEVDMRDIDHNGTPAQHSVVDRPEVCRYLLSRGAALDIFMAVQLGDMELVRRTLDADPASLRAHVGSGPFTSGDSTGGHIYLYKLKTCTSPVLLAAELKHRDIYELLLQRCTPVERLLAACLTEDEPAVREIVAKQPELVASIRPEQARFIADAAWAHKTAAVRLMLSIGMDIDAQGDHRSTALNRAAVRGYADLIQLLLEHGASLELRNEFGGRPLAACIWGAENFRDPKGDYPRSVELLLAAGAPLGDVRIPCTDRRVNAILRKHLESLSGTSLIAAIKLGAVDRVISLLEADPQRANRPESDLLPLHTAVRSGNADLVQLLLRFGADPERRDSPSGSTARDLAEASAAPEIVDLLAPFL